MPASINRHWYVGDCGYYRQDPTLDYIRLRYYSQPLSRFVSGDPVNTGLRYGYACATPGRFIDPSGSIPTSVDRGWVQANAFIPGRFGKWVSEPGTTWFFNSNERSFGGGSSKLWCDLFFSVTPRTGIRLTDRDCKTGITCRWRVGRPHPYPSGRSMTNPSVVEPFIWIEEQCKQADVWGYKWQIQSRKCNKVGTVCELTARYYAHAGYPFHLFVPHIYIGGRVTLSVNGMSLSVDVDSRHTRFPNHEFLASFGSIGPSRPPIKIPPDRSRIDLTLWRFETSSPGPWEGLGWYSFTGTQFGDRRFDLRRPVCCDGMLVTC